MKKFGSLLAVLVLAVIATACTASVGPYVRPASDTTQVQFVCGGPQTAVAQPAPVVDVPAPKAAPTQKKYVRKITRTADGLVAGTAGGNEDSSKSDGETLEITIDGDDNAPFDPLQADPYTRPKPAPVVIDSNLRAQTLRLQGFVPAAQPAPAQQSAPAQAPQLASPGYINSGGQTQFGGAYYGNGR